MDTDNSDPLEPMIYFKIEPELDSPSPSLQEKKEKIHWTSKNTYKLIEILKSECIELWDTKHYLYKDRSARQVKYDYLAKYFGCTSEEISRKIHNLRTQFNSELRKIKKRMSLQGASEDSPLVSGWEYFEAMSFILAGTSASDHIDTEENSGNSLFSKSDISPARAPPEESESSSSRNIPNFDLEAPSTSGSSLEQVRPLEPRRVAARAPAPPPANPLMWVENHEPSIRPSRRTDEYQVFGNFVASELRLLRSNDLKVRLKMIIQKAVLEIGEQDLNRNRHQ